jgi:hypothetical protein
MATKIAYSHKNGSKNLVGGKSLTVLGMIFATEAARSAQGIIFHDFHAFRLHFS